MGNSLSKLFISNESPKDVVKVVENDVAFEFASSKPLYYPLMAFLLDTFFIFIAFETVQFFAEPINLENTLPVSISLVFAAISLLWVLVGVLGSLYQLNRTVCFGSEIYKVVNISIIGLIVSMGFLYFLNWQISRFVFVQYMIIGIIYLVIWRLLYYGICYANHVSNMKTYRRVLVIASSDHINQLISMLNHIPKQYLTIVGVITDNQNLNRLTYLGDLNTEIGDLISKHKVDDVVMAFSRNYDVSARRFLTNLQGQNVQIYVLPAYMGISVLKLNRAKSLDDLVLVKVSSQPLSRVSLFIKRILDIMIASIALTVSITIIMMIALAIKLESNGPIIFVQNRVGLNEKTFSIFKFRSMRVGADKQLNLVSELGQDGHVINHKHRNDPRVTFVGKFIRKTSLDELPQLFNVLRGDMSIVGPRPELERLVKEYEPWQFIRFNVQQGITGWWQVTGRSENLCHRSTHQDIEYINNYSLLFDLQIMIMTLPAVLKGRGAF